MNIKEVEALGFPIRVKLNKNFNLDESVDPGTIIQINKIDLDALDGDEGCYKVAITLLNEDMDYNQSIASSDWFDKHGNACLNYYQVSLNEKQLNGDYKSFIYVMSNDDVFDLVEEKENVVDLILKELRKQVENNKSNVAYSDESIYESNCGEILGLERAIEIIEKYK